MNNDITLLYVEDEIETAQEYTSVFKKHFTHVIVAYCASEALNIITQQTQIDVIITDIEIGRFDGLELLKTVKEMRPEIKRIVLSAFSQKDYINRASDIGIDFYWIKPILQEVMNRNLNDLLSEIIEAKNPQSKEESLVVKINEIYSFDNKTLILYKNDEPFRVPLRETTMINYMINSDRNKSFSIEELMDVIWFEPDKESSEGSLRGLINNLKDKLKIEEPLKSNNDYKVIVYDRPTRTYRLNFTKKEEK